MIKNTIMLIASLGFLLFLAVRPATIYEYGVVKSITKFEVGDTINFTTIKVSN